MPQRVDDQFRAFPFAALSALELLSGLAVLGSMLLLPLYYQDVRGQSAVAAGLLLAPQDVCSLLACGIGGLADWIGPRPVILLGIALTVLGTLPFVLAGQQASAVILAAALAVRGAGLSAANVAIVVGAFQGLERKRISHASSCTRIMQQLGASWGTAVRAVVPALLLPRAAATSSSGKA